MKSDLHDLESMRWCVSTLGCAELNLEEAVALASDFGIRELELRALEDELDLPTYFEKTYKTPEALAQAVDSLGVRITVLDTSLGLVGSSDADRQQFLRFLPWAEALGSRWLRVFDGGKNPEMPTPAEFEEAIGTVKWWQAIRSENNYKADIVMETHDGFCSSAACLALQKRLETPCPILWDTHHTFYKMKEPVAETWQAIRPYVCHIHFKDSTPVGNQTNSYTCAIPGTGTFPTRELIRLLQRDGYAGAFSLEWERKWQPQIPPLREALEGLSAHLQK